MTILDKLYGLSTKQRNLIIRVFVVLLAVIPFIYPLGIPIPMDKQTKEFIQQLESLKAGDVVVVEWDIGPDSYNNAAFSSSMVVRRLFEKRVKFVCYVFHEKASATFPKMLTETTTFPQGVPVEYGKDYIYLGFVAGEEMAMAAVYKNPWVTERDYYGTRITDLPLARQISKFADFKMIIQLNAAVNFSVALYNQWATPSKLTVIGVYPAAEWILTQPYYPVIVKGMVQDVIGAAAMERHYGIKYKATTIVDAMNLTNLYLILVIIIANLAWILRRKA